jgi:hypothetical protein
MSRLGVVEESEIPPKIFFEETKKHCLVTPTSFFDPPSSVRDSIDQGFDERSPHMLLLMTGSKINSIVIIIIIIIIFMMYDVSLLNYFILNEEQASDRAQRRKILMKLLPTFEIYWLWLPQN